MIGDARVDRDQRQPRQRAASRAELALRSLALTTAPPRTARRSAVAMPVLFTRHTERRQRC
jgi:hypothetical protein